MRQADFQVCRRYFPPFQPTALTLLMILLGGRGLAWDNIPDAESQQPGGHHDVPPYKARRSESDQRSEHSTIRDAQMKKRTVTVLTVLALLAYQPLAAHAGRITMQLTEQEETESGKTLCRYENSIYSFSYVTLRKHCPSVKTFDTEDSD